MTIFIAVRRRRVKWAKGQVDKIRHVGYFGCWFHNSHDPQALLLTRDRVRVGRKQRPANGRSCTDVDDYPSGASAGDVVSTGGCARHADARGPRVGERSDHDRSLYPPLSLLRPGRTRRHQAASPLQTISMGDEECTVHALCQRCWYSSRSSAPSAAC